MWGPKSRKNRYRDSWGIRLWQAVKPTLISWYIIREQIPPLLAAIFFFTLIFIINKVLLLLALLIEKNVPPEYSLELFLLMIPFSMALTVPISILMATIMAMGRLSSDSEITAMRSSGVSYFRIYRSLVFMGTVYTVILILFNNYVLPYANYRYSTLHNEIMQSQPITLLEERVFNTIPGTQQTIYVKELDQKNGRMRHVLVYRKNQNEDLDLIIAQRGQWLNENKKGNYKTLRLYHGYLHSPDREGEGYTIIDFSEQYMDINLWERGIGQGDKERQKSEREKSMEEIYAGIQKFKEQHKPPRKDKEKKELAYRWLEFWKHWTIPFAALALTLIGAPLGIVSHRSGKGMGFGFAIVVSFVYYLLLMTGERLAESRTLAPWMGAWLPVATVTLIGVLLIYFRNSFESVVEAGRSLSNRLWRTKKRKEND